MNKFSVIPIVFVILASNFPAFARQTNEVKCEGYTGASAETKNYYVNICNSDNKENPLTFVLTEKKVRQLYFQAIKKIFCRQKVVILNTF